VTIREPGSQVEDETPWTGSIGVIHGNRSYWRSRCSIWSPSLFRDMCQSHASDGGDAWRQRGRRFYRVPSRRCRKWRSGSQTRKPVPRGAFPWHMPQRPSPGQRGTQSNAASQANDMRQRAAARWNCGTRAARRSNRTYRSSMVLEGMPLKWYCSAWLPALSVPSPRIASCRKT
jgi:hypothetical protein